MRSLFALIALGAAVAACAPASPPATDGDGGAAFTAGDPPTTPGPLAGSDGALGSGCAPGAGALPDGAWYGHAVAWDATGIEFDLVCFYVGDAAAAQASARNDESPNDFYFVNDDAATRRLDVGGDITAYRLTSSEGPVGVERTTFGDLVVNPGPEGLTSCPGRYCSVWIFVNQGRVTEVMLQYIP